MTNPVPACATSLPDDEPSIVRRIAAGDAAAFELLMRRHNRRLYRLARATLRCDAEAEEALQEAYLCAYRSSASFRGEASLLTWLSRLVLNECFARIRKRARRQNIFPIADDTENEVDAMAANDSNPPYHAAARAEVRALLEARVDQLPESYRMVFVLCAVGEMTVEETAQCLQIPEATVRIRHFRAKGLLRELLARDMDLSESSPFEFGGDHCDRIVAALLSRAMAIRYDTPEMLSNLFADLPVPGNKLDSERLDDVLARPGLRIERIVSTGQSSPPGFWYDQPQHEWVAVLAGSAGLRIEGEPAVRTLRAGDFVELPAHCRHRVEWTDATVPTVWLAVHYGP